MKGRESGMPQEAYWASFFNTEAVIETMLGSTAESGNVVEFGCGYGTFTLAAARRNRGIVTALDIDPEMVATVKQKAQALAMPHIRAELRDFVGHGSGLSTGTQQHAMIFNLLHLEQPVALLQEAHRVLQAGGELSVMHWRSDIPTPRGPSLSIRPTPAQCRAWMTEAGFHSIEEVDLQTSCPFHFGLLAKR
jgi:ubiquinone/menaquinone biosynthesis C-methylase UbiE